MFRSTTPSLFSAVRLLIATVFVIFVIQTVAVGVNASAPEESCTVVSGWLNLRSGPGTSYRPPITSLRRGTDLTPLGRNAANTWVKVQVANTSTVGWVSGGRSYVRCNFDIEELDIVDMSVPSQQEASPRVPCLVYDFEDSGGWIRGDEHWGTFTTTAERAYTGNRAGKFEYDIPAGVSPNYFLYRRTGSALPLLCTPDELRMQVYGDNSGSFLNVWLRDSRGQLWQFTFGRVFHNGWKEMTAPLNIALGWPNQAIDASLTNEPVLPFDLYALVIDAVEENVDIGGIVYLDELTSGAGTATPRTTPAVQTTRVPTATPLASLWADDDEIAQGNCTTIHWRVENVRVVYFDGDGAAGISSRRVCPGQTRSYYLHIVDNSGEEHQEVIVVRVRPASRDVPGVTAIPTAPTRLAPSTTPSVSFWADDTEIDQGDCTGLHWRVENVQAVYVNGDGVVGNDNWQVCPSHTSTYELRVVTGSGEELYRAIIIRVRPAQRDVPGVTATPTVPIRRAPSITATASPTNTPSR